MAGKDKAKEILCREKGGSGMSVSQGNLLEEMGRKAGRPAHKLSKWRDIQH